MKNRLNYCNKKKKILVAIRDLEDDNTDVIFVQKGKDEYEEVFEAVKMVVLLCDDFVKQIKLFTEKQDIRNIRPYGTQRTVLLKE